VGGQGWVKGGIERSEEKGKGVMRPKETEKGRGGGTHQVKKWRRGGREKREGDRREREV